MSVSGSIRSSNNSSSERQQRGASVMASSGSPSCLLILLVILVSISSCLPPAMAFSLRRQQRNIGAVCENRMKQCAVIPPYLCYVQHNNAVCCETCESYRQQNTEWCPYGDRKVLIEQDGQRFSCASYITVFGTSRCLFDAEFKRVCCQSCADT